MGNFESMAAELAAKIREIEALMPSPPPAAPELDPLAKAIVEGDTKGEALVRAAIEKYGALFTYATERLAHEEERFNRADDKAFKLATAFVFLTGATAFFCKRVVETVIPPRGSVEWAVALSAAATLILSFFGWLRSIRVMRLKGYESLPLNREVLDFFELHSLLTISGRLSETALKAYETTKHATDAKMAKLDEAFVFARRAAGSLGFLVCVFIWCFWQNPAKFRAMSDSPKPTSPPVLPTSEVIPAPAQTPSPNPATPISLPKPNPTVRPLRTTEIAASEVAPSDIINL